jgi:hypothetical protein
MGARQIATTAGHGRPDLLGQVGPDGTGHPSPVPSRPNGPNSSHRLIADGYAIAALLGEAEAAGCSFAVAGARVTLLAEGRPPDGLVARLREYRAEILELLRGGRCRHCGARLAWPAPVGVVHAGGKASCWGCYYAAAAHRAVASPDALADEAEVVLRGEPLP